MKIRIRAIESTGLTVMGQKELTVSVNKAAPTRIVARGIVRVGPEGKSAYQVWLDLGNTGTEQDFIDSLKGDKGDPGDPAVGSYEHVQMVASTQWTINHGLGFYPNATVVDSAGDVVVGEKEYIDINTMKISFSAPFGGKAYLS